jgi:hypothetical protein
MLERSRKMRTNEMMRDTDDAIKDLYENRTPIVEACTKVQLSVKEKSIGNNPPTYKTEVIDSLCSRIDGNLCGACAYPDKKWRLGICNLATHLYIENKMGEAPKFLTPITMEFVGAVGKIKIVNPIKQSKRG